MVAPDVAQAVSELVDTVKVALVAPAATVTLVGTVATAVLLLPSATTAPPAGAGAVKITVPVEAVRLLTLVGLRLKEDNVVGGAGVTVSMAQHLAAEVITA